MPCSPHSVHTGVGYCLFEHGLPEPLPDKRIAPHFLFVSAKDGARATIIIFMVKLIHLDALQSKIEEARIDLQQRALSRKQLTDISYVEELAAFLPLVVDYVLDNYSDNKKEDVLRELEKWLKQRELSAYSSVTDEQLLTLLSILFTDPWQKRRYSGE